MSEDTYVGGMPMPNAANPAQIRAATKLRDWKTDEQGNDLRTVLQSIEGRRVILRMLDEAGVWVDAFSPDPYRTARDVGYQAFGKTIIAWLGKADPMIFPRLLVQRLEDSKQEAKDRQTLVDQEKSV